MFINFRVNASGAVMLTLAVVIVLALLSGCAALGASPSEERLDRVLASPEWRDGQFRNAQNLWTDVLGVLRHRFDSTAGETPDAPIAVQPSDGRQLATPPASGLRVTWFGHSSTLIEIDGVTVLTDPLWTRRISPVSWAGPIPWHPPPIAGTHLPEVDAVVISHDHYDHLDYDTIAAMRACRMGIRRCGRASPSSARSIAPFTQGTRVSCQRCTTLANAMARSM